MRLQRTMPQILRLHISMRTVLAVLNSTRLKHGYSLADWIYWLSLKVKLMRVFPIVCSMSKVFVFVVETERPEVEG